MEKNGDIHTKSLRKRILIAAVNGMLLIPVTSGDVWYWYLGLIVFAVNVVPALTWEKNENVKTKSKRLIFFSPVIKGIIGIIVGPMIGLKNVYFPDVIIYNAVDVIPAYSYSGAIYGAIIGLIQILVHFSRRVLERKKQTTSLLY